MTNDDAMTVAFYKGREVEVTEERRGELAWVRFLDNDAETWAPVRLLRGAGRRARPCTDR